MHRKYHNSKYRLNIGELSILFLFNTQLTFIAALSFDAGHPWLTPVVMFFMVSLLGMLGVGGDCGGGGISIV